MCEVFKTRGQLERFINCCEEPIPASANDYVNAGEIPLVGREPYLIRYATR
jgi:hypothetical protein